MKPLSDLPAKISVTEPLFDLDAYLETVPEPDPRNPQFTGARFFEKRPEVVPAVIHLTALGWGVNRISDLLQLSGHTVLLVREKHAGDVATEKAKLAGQAKICAQLAMEEIERRLLDPIARKSMQLSTLPYIVDKLLDKWLLLSGEATSRIEHTTESDPGAFERWLQATPTAEVASIGPATDRGEEKNGGKGTGPALEDGAEAGAEVGDQGAAATPGPADLDQANGAEEVKS